MVLKKARQEKILGLIRKYDIQTQEEMIMRLEESGYPVTQATVSRDIRELNLVKGISPRGIYRYTVAVKKEEGRTKFGTVMTDSITSVDHAGNMVVIKTFPGMASAVATCVDSMNLPEIVGSIAGDDAIFIVVRDEGHASAISEKLHHMVRGV
jgi:transcriptional regulator of arginine metabolism